MSWQGDARARYRSVAAGRFALGLLVLVFPEPTDLRAQSSGDHSFFEAEIVPSWRRLRDKVSQLQGEFVVRNARRPRETRGRFFACNGLIKIELTRELNEPPFAVFGRNDRYQFEAARIPITSDALSDDMILNRYEPAEQDLDEEFQEYASLPQAAYCIFFFNLLERFEKGKIRVSSVDWVSVDEVRIQGELTKQYGTANEVFPFDITCRKSKGFAIERWKYKTSNLRSGAGETRYFDSADGTFPASGERRVLNSQGVVSRREEFQLSPPQPCSLSPSDFLLSAYGIEAPPLNGSSSDRQPKWSVSLVALLLFLLGAFAWTRYRHR
jgi:hypothetical protein